MADLMGQNEFLVDFLEEAKKRSFPRLIHKLQTEGEQVIPDVVALALVVERLTKLIYNNPALLEKFIIVCRNSMKEANLVKHMSWFYKTKLISVEKGLKLTYIKCQKSGKVPKAMSKRLVPVNILEAVTCEYSFGFKENARVGLALARCKPGAKTCKPSTGEGPSCWASDKKGICLYMPLPKAWANLYQSWSMAFVATGEDFPYLLTQFLIPQVADYHKEPQKYMHTRAIALYIILVHCPFFRGQGKKKNTPPIQWFDEALARLWGKVNIESMKKYQERLKIAKTFKVAR